MLTFAPTTTRPIRPRGESWPAVRRVALTLLALVACPVVAVAQPVSVQGSREYAIKGAYIYNFANYVRWPAECFDDHEDPFVIGLLGPDPFTGVLDRIAQEKRIEGRPIQIQRFRNLDEFDRCHILFVTSAVPHRVELLAIEQVNQGSGVLLIGERTGFAERGGAINFIVEQNKVRFEVNPRAAERQGLKISSQVLRLATLVDEP